MIKSWKAWDLPLNALSKKAKKTIFKSTGLTWENGEGRQTKVPAITGASGLCILNTGNYLPSGTPHHTKCEPTQTIVRSIVLVLDSTHCLKPKCCNGLTQNHKVSPMLQKKYPYIGCCKCHCSERFSFCWLWSSAAFCLEFFWVKALVLLVGHILVTLGDLRHGPWDRTVKVQSLNWRCWKLNRVFSKF